MRPAPGPWLRADRDRRRGRLLLAVVSGTAGWDTAHRVLAALALPPLIAVVVAAWTTHRRLLAAGAGVGAALRRGRGRDGRRRRTSRSRRWRSPRRSSTARAHLPRRAASLRPVARLRHAHEAADHVAAPAHRRLRDVRRRGRRPAARRAGRAADRPRARVRRRERVQPRDGRDIDKLMGKRTEKRPVAAGRVSRRRARSSSRWRCRRPRSSCSQPRQRAVRRARARRQPLLRPRLHALAEALDAEQHRHRRRGRRGAAARRLVGRDREPDAAGALPLPGRLPLDAAALLGARAAHPATTTRRRRCRCSRSSAASARRCARSCSTRWCWSASRCSRSTWSMFGLGYAIGRARARRRSSSGWRGGCGARRARAARRCSSTTPCSTSRCSSSRWRSTRSWRVSEPRLEPRHSGAHGAGHRAGSRAPAQERALRARALRAVDPDRDRHGADRVRVPAVRLVRVALRGAARRRPSPPAAGAAGRAPAVDENAGTLGGRALRRDGRPGARRSSAIRATARTGSSRRAWSTADRRDPVARPGHGHAPERSTTAPAPYLVSPTVGVYAMATTAKGSTTKAGVGVGDPLAGVATSFKHIDCGRYGRRREPTYNWCRATLPKAKVFFGGDPIRSITLTRP